MIPPAVTAARFERATYCLGNSCSIQLSYAVFAVNSGLSGNSQRGTSITRILAFVTVFARRACFRIQGRPARNQSFLYFRDTAIVVCAHVGSVGFGVAAGGGPWGQVDSHDSPNAPTEGPSVAHDSRRGCFRRSETRAMMGR